MTRPLEALFAPERLGASWGAGRGPAAARPDAPGRAQAGGEAAAALDALDATVAALPGPGARAALAMVAQLRALLAAAPPGAPAPAEAAALLDRLEDLVDAVELGAGRRP